MKDWGNLYDYEDFDHKILRSYKQQQSKKFKSIMVNKTVYGLGYIYAALMNIKYQKEILMINLEQGREVLIPRDLSQDKFPSSFTFYDAIFS